MKGGALTHPRLPIIAKRVRWWLFSAAPVFPENGLKNRDGNDTGGRSFLRIDNVIAASR
jgi:hypothetical protein